VLEDVAAITRKMFFRSLNRKGRGSQSTLRDLAHERIFGVACGAITRSFAPVSIRPAILDSATDPAPTTRHRRFLSFRKSGNSLILGFRLEISVSVGPG